MSQDLHIIYLPGLGDHNPNFQKRLLRHWQKPGLEVHFLPMAWTTDEPLNTKLKRVTDKIDKLHKSGNAVGLVGVSGGASAAINAYLARPSQVSKVVYICGKLHGSKEVGPAYYRRNPMFKECLLRSEENLSKLTAKDKVKMLSLHPIIDEVVYTRFTKIPGVREQVVPSLLHLPTIFFTLTIYKKMVINFLK